MSISFLDFLNDYKDAWLAIAGLVGLLLLGVRASAQARSAKSAERQAAISEQGHITDRYIKAIDQLGATDSKGNPNIEVRLGGIYGLEKVAAESGKHYSQIMEVLTAYVRENSSNNSTRTLGSEINEGMKEVVIDPEELIISPHKPAVDIQAILTVIGRRERRNNDETIDLSNSYLSMYLFEGDFSGTDFSRANCEAARFDRANCEEANFSGATCKGASFNTTNCKKAWFSVASFQEAIFANNACLKEAKFISTHLEGAVFNNVELEGSEFYNVHLDDAKFTDSNYHKSNIKIEDYKNTIFDSVEE